MFCYATRNKLRFPFKGMCSVEDLWDLSLTNLDSIFKTLNARVKVQEEESLLNTKSREDKELNIKINIVKHIVATKLDEADKAKNAKAKKEKNEKILSIIASKKDAELHEMSIEDLSKLIKEDEE